MQPRRVLITGAAGTIGTVLRPALRDGLSELRLSDLREPDDLVAPETFVAADLTDQAAVQAAIDGVDAVVHLGAVPTETSFEAIAGPNLHGAFHVFEACRRAGVRRIVYASSNHASGMYPVGVPLDGSQRARPDGLYGASKAYGEALGANPAIWNFATGDSAEVAALARQFSVFTERKGVLLDHTLCTALIGPDGRVREIWRGNGWTTRDILTCLQAQPEYTR